MANVIHNPLVSIIVRTKDRPNLLKRALKSISAQIYRHVEVVLVNDGGCDLNVGELRTILGGIPLNYIRLEKNMGRSNAGNVGIENAKGKYVGFLDDDDEFYANHAITLVSFLEKSDYSVAYSDSLMVYKEYNPETHDLDKVVKKELAFSWDFNYDRLVFENYIPFMCLLFEKKVLVGSGGFDNSFDLYEDWDLLIRVGRKHPFYHVREVTASYNQWSVDFQISQVNRDPVFLRQAYLKVLSTHIDKITPNRIHDYMSEYVHARHLLKEFRHESERYEGVLKDRDSQIDRITAESRDKDRQIEKSLDELKEKDSELERRVDELRQRDEKIDVLADEIEQRESQLDILNSELKGKDVQIDKLYTELKDRGPRVESLYNELRERDSQVSALSAELKERDARIDALVAELMQWSSQSDVLSSGIKEREARIAALHAELGERDSLINSLNAELMDRDAKMFSLSMELNERNTQVDALVDSVRKKDSSLDSAASEVEGKKAEIMILQNMVRERDALITAMRNTRGWRILEKYRKVRDRVGIRPGTREVRTDSVTDSGVRRESELKSHTKLDGGGRSVDRFAGGSAGAGPRRSRISDRLPNNVIGDPIRSRASIIIPTKNAGDEFDYTMRRIMQQEGVGEIEVIIVDSGSEDRTLDIAGRYTENVVRVSPEDFHHARTRNLGAEKATGDFLVFTVQDAIPVSNFWLHRLLYPVYLGEASAVSARQIPRADADLFASWAMWVHNHYLGYDHDRLISHSIFRNFESLDIQGKRAAAGLDSVCLGIRKSVFDSYRFSSGYGEDLDLGVRLLTDNHILLFQSSNGVIHSHNRPAIYFLKRGYVDTIYLWQILQVERKSLPSRPVLETISFLYYLLKICMVTLNVECEFNKEPFSLIHSFLNNFEGKLSVVNFTGEFTRNGGEPLLDNFFEQFHPTNHQHISSEIYSAMRGSLLSFGDFMKSFTSIEDVRDDFMRSIYKIFSNTAGYYLGANTQDTIDVLAGGV
jgi:glycosyltransferase involved in cell wall biosynthesis